MQVENLVVGVTSSPDTKEHDLAFHKAQSLFKAVHKTGVNSFHKFSFDTLTDIVTAVRPGLSEAGICWRFEHGLRDGIPGMYLVAVHVKSGQWVRHWVDLELPVDHKTQAIRRGHEAVQSADTNARKRLLRSYTACWMASPNECEGSQEPVTEAEEQQPKPLSKRVKRADKVTPDEISKRAVAAIVNAKSLAEAKKFLRTANERFKEGKISAENLEFIDEQFKQRWEKK